MNKKINISFLIFSLFLHLNSAELINGDKDAPEGKTFSFNVGKNILSSTGNFYESANENLILNQEFSLSRLIRGTRSFTPLMAENITLNGVQGVSNPLFGTRVLALGMLETEDGFSIRDIPIVVGENRPATVYLLENISQIDNTIMASSNDVHDANGAVSPGVVDLTTNNVSHVFAAVKPNGGEFGQLNSGISLLIRGTIEIPQGADKSTMRIFSEINAVNGSIVMPQALRLDPTSPALVINNNLALIAQNQVAMHWDNSLERLFVGLNVMSNSGASDGARAIAVFKFVENGAIALETIVPDTVFTPGNTNNIIGVRGPNQQVTINALTTMYSSTALHYLIVVGGVGNNAAITNAVYALPLVNTGEFKGMIAQKNAQPLNVFKNVSVSRLIARTISQAATTPNEMTQSTDSAAQIGGGQLMTGPIIDILVRDDTVFAFVAEDSPGIYSSQALFDAAGKITSWTPWQRAAGTTDAIFGATLNAFEGNFILASGTRANAIDTIRRTVWSDGSPTGLQPLTSILNNTFAPNNGGIQSLYTFLPYSPGLRDNAILAAGGIGSILLAQTGTVNSTGIIIPTTAINFNTIAAFTNGTISDNVNALTTIISGGALDEIGPITALEVARNAMNAWLFVGGSNGLTILAQPDGTGWNPVTQLGSNFEGLDQGMSFKIVGTYNFVKKLIYDSNFLYVIAHDRIDRINLEISDFGTNDLSITTIASTGQNGITSGGGFLDGIFSQACGIIATTNGLFRIGNDKDIRLITSQDDAEWMNVPIGENAGSPTALYALTSTNRPQDITRNHGGCFYVLTADAGLNQSRINRFAVQPLDQTDTMNALTIQAFDDIFVKNIPSFLLSFGEFRSNFATDGALYFATRNQNINLSPVVLLTPASPVPRVGVATVGDRSSLVRINFQQGSEINAFTRSQASGSWIAAGNFNTQVLE